MSLSSSSLNPSLRATNDNRSRGTASAMTPLSILGPSSPSSNTTTKQPILRWEGQEYLYVLPVLLLEFLALALTRAVLPSLLLEAFQDRIYFVMGCAECIRGLLAFVACPLFGKISDVVGRRACLFVTVLGTCCPVCVLALLPPPSTDPYSTITDDTLEMTSQNAAAGGEMEWSYMNWGVGGGRVDRIWVFIILLSLSGIFSSTFTLTFAYISDTVSNKKDRVTAYGLALATFGLSFTVGPMAGGYLARDHDNPETVHPVGQQRVFYCSLFLTILDLAYIYFILPESVQHQTVSRPNPSSATWHNTTRNVDEDEEDGTTSVNTVGTSVRDIVHRSWSPLDTLKVFAGDPLLLQVGKVAFLYYTALWAVISTLILYAAKRFHMGPERLGELMSAFGLCTMLAEAVLVRILVPVLGEKGAVRLGLAAFSMQCIVLGLANEGWQLFVCVALSMLGNLVYPSLTSLVSSSVAPHMVGEALGAINGIKALTEGIGPLVFGFLLTISEDGPLPGWPYLIAALLALAAYQQSQLLPDENDEDYISERYDHQKHQSSSRGTVLELFTTMTASSKTRAMNGSSALSQLEEQEEQEEFMGLLSEVEETDDERGNDEATDNKRMLQRFPVGMSSIVGTADKPSLLSVPSNQ
mmetsp:Transcript_12332/g.22384  ORF Transcript_12332/g.22384 Transcript_12332/m.22384 type:complete len:640 (-) Transcript_12332:265-2184(-)|eukprot:CAMPEP_0198296916 /NCGR_PEP_ID=MMETSP1449-20131203/34567_1 /TAXON_ID=420275 /ORGANISM="Attheya septentrionalis, Strain CCMP2084" /LENGTH=639 /DNA_ID=CAMNT_0043997665 /DNA_START=306 /DNA_END=2225 /DNA_ORIENTATION=+